MSACSFNHDPSYTITRTLPHESFVGGPEWPRDGEGDGSSCAGKIPSDSAGLPTTEGRGSISIHVRSVPPEMYRNMTDHRVGPVNVPRPKDEALFRHVFPPSLFIDDHHGYANTNGRFLKTHFRIERKRTLFEQLGLGIYSCKIKT